MTDLGPAALPVDQEHALQALADRYLEDLDNRVVLLVAHLKRDIPEYGAVPAEDVELSTAAIVRSALGSIGSLIIDASEIDALTALARRRVEQGFPLEALTRSIQLAARFLLLELGELAEAAGVEGRTMLRAQDSAWHFANDAAAVISAVNREMAVELARRDSDRRSDFLRAVLHGGIDPRRVQAEAALYGLDPGVAYMTIRARPADQHEEDAIAFAVRRTGSTSTHRPVLGVLEGDLVGLVPGRPTVDEAHVVALGDPCHLVDARRSFLATGVALDAARAFGRRGAVCLADLGPLPLALVGEDFADVLERRYLEALEREAAGHDVEDTVRVWLEHDQRLDDVAAALHVHRNTVRYRVARFRELTGLDLRTTDGFVTAWWLLARRRARAAADR